MGRGGEDVEREKRQQLLGRNKRKRIHENKEKEDEIDSQGKENTRRKLGKE